MILKPFMLRRIKKDVENELSDKIEVMVYCPLTTRQRLLYMALKQKIRIEDLLHYTVGGGDSHTVDKNFTSNLMNLVMQFRKVRSLSLLCYLINGLLTLLGLQPSGAFRKKGCKITNTFETSRV